MFVIAESAPSYLDVLLEREAITERQKRTALRLHSSRGGLLATWLVHSGAKEDDVMNVLSELSGYELADDERLQKAAISDDKERDADFWWQLGGAPLGSDALVLTTPAQAEYAADTLQNVKIFLAAERQIRLIQTRLFGPRPKEITPFVKDLPPSEKAAPDKTDSIDRKALNFSDKKDAKSSPAKSKGTKSQSTSNKKDESLSTGKLDVVMNTAVDKETPDESPPFDKTDLIEKAASFGSIEEHLTPAPNEGVKESRGERDLAEELGVSQSTRENIHPSILLQTAQEKNKGSLDDFEAAATIAAPLDELLAMNLDDIGQAPEEHAPTLAMSREDVMNQLRSMDIPEPSDDAEKFDEPTFAMPRAILEEYLSMNGDALPRAIDDDKTVLRDVDSKSLDAAAEDVNDFDEPTIAAPYASLDGVLPSALSGVDSVSPTKQVGAMPKISQADIEYFDDDWSKGMPQSPGFENESTEMLASLREQSEEMIILDGEGERLETQVEKPDVSIAGYQALTELGTGGMASVYRARDLKKDRIVALKVLSPSLAEDRQFIERFKRETRACASLDNAHIVKVFDYGSHKGVYYMATEVMDCGSIRDLLTEFKRLPIAVALKIFEHILKALHAADDAGIVHRDVKPGNVLLSKEGFAKLCDFGIAKAESDSTITKTGALFGTPAYMSPEQTLGRALDGRSDLFSAGVIFYEALAGVNPFICENASGTLLRVSRVAIPPVVTHLPGVPSLITNVLERLLVRNPDDRYSQASEVLADLAPLIDLVDDLHPNLLKEYLEKGSNTHVKLQRALSQNALQHAQNKKQAFKESAYWAYAAYHFDKSNAKAKSFLDAATRHPSIAFDDTNNPAIRQALRGIEDTPDDPALLRQLVSLYDDEGNVHLAVSYALQLLRVQDNEDAQALIDSVLGNQMLAPLTPVKSKSNDSAPPRDANEGVGELFKELSAERPRPKLERREDPRVVALRQEIERSKRNPSFGSLKVNSVPVTSSPQVAPPAAREALPPVQQEPSPPVVATPKQGLNYKALGLALIGLLAVAAITWITVQNLPPKRSFENAQSLVAEGKHEQALSMLNLVLQKGKSEDKASTLLLRAQCHLELGNKGFAKADATAVLKLNPDVKSRQAANLILQKLQ